MLRLASALARLLTKEPNSPSTSKANSPAPRKRSLKSKPSWRSASVQTDNRTQNYKCPFTATNALTAVTKKEIDAYNSSEEIRTPVASSTSRINEETIPCKEFQRRNSGIKFESPIVKEPVVKPILESDQTEDIPTTSEVSSAPISPDSEIGKKGSIKKSTVRKTSCTVALDVYKRRGSIISARQRLNSISLMNGDKLNMLREKFETPEKVMHFFGRCFVKFFSNYG